MLKYIRLEETDQRSYLLTFQFDLGLFGIEINRSMSLHSVLLSLISLTEEMKKHVKVN